MKLYEVYFKNVESNGRNDNFWKQCYACDMWYANQPTQIYGHARSVGFTVERNNKKILEPVNILFYPVYNGGGLLTYLMVSLPLS